jgi:hypothetical protein
MKKICLIACVCVLASANFSRAEDVSTPAHEGFEYHLALEILPIAESVNNPAGGGFGLVFENWHHSRELISLIGVEADQDYGDHYRTDVIANFGLLARVVEGIYVGARLGVVTNYPNDPNAFGALAIRALLPITPHPGFFGPLFTEADLGVSGAGHQYGAVRFGFKLF